MTTDVECCPKFDPQPWADKQITWQDKLFLKARVKSFLHMPLNFGAVMECSMSKIRQAGAEEKDTIVLSDENSLWGADAYISVAKAVPETENVKLSGTFLSKVFEGPYSNMGKWIKQMKQYVEEKGKCPAKFYFYYTTCPKCAKKYGKNYVVILAQV